MPTDDLDQILLQAGIEATRLERQELGAISRTVSLGSPAEYIDAATLADGLGWENGQARPTGTYEIHNRHWWIDISDLGNREHLVTVTVAAALLDVIEPRLNFSVGWVTVVLPTVLALRSVRRDDAGLRLHLVRLAAPQLPAALADTVNLDDYADFVAAVAAVPPVQPLRVGGTITVTP
jgi:hypothetical protein